MASSEFWQRFSSSRQAAGEGQSAPGAGSVRGGHAHSKLWMAADVATVVVVAAGTTFYRLHTGPVAGVRDLWRGTLIEGQPVWRLLEFLLGFTVVLVMVSRRLHLYAPLRIASILHEQRRNAQACLTAGLLLTGALYLAHAVSIPREIVLWTVGLVMVAAGLRRLVYRLLLYRQFDRGVGTRNVLIVGTGAEARALRHHLESMRNLGYTFKGYVTAPGEEREAPGEVVGSLETLFESVRRFFVDEIFFTTRCSRETVQGVLEQARAQGVDLRLVPDLYQGLAWNSPVEYVGQFPTIPLHCGRVPEVALGVKRVFDVLFSAVVLLALAPVFAVIALAIKLDSPGPVLYRSERLGKKGRVFRCTKFRTMVADAERRKAELLHMNERDGVLFKVSNDPRVTRLGRFLRKYSLDELPQFWNVLKGEMSVVGPRPPLASEVKQYQLSHLRRLDVIPGITGLWQVQGRRDSSFASYVSLDVTYIDNWSVWLDFKIILRTIGVVFEGTGS